MSASSQRDDGELGGDISASQTDTAQGQKRAAPSEDPFARFVGLWDRSPLDTLRGRRACEFCGRKAKFYCYFCCVVTRDITDVEEATPLDAHGKGKFVVPDRPGFSKGELSVRAKSKTVDTSVVVTESVGEFPVSAEQRRFRPPYVPILHDLGARVDIVHHFLEIRGKSTAIHAKVLAPDCVRFFDFPDLPDYRRANVANHTALHAPVGTTDGNDAVEALTSQALGPNTVLLFPTAGSRTVAEMSDDEVAAIERVVVVDSTWAQAKQILADPRLSELPCVRLGEQYKTEFWRYQDMGEDHLATIEAIYWILRELWERRNRGQQHPYTGELDNILFYYSHLHEVVQQTYRANPTKRSKLTKNKRKGYIRTD